MPKVKRIFPGAANGLINWMEQNFHDIDEFVVTFRMKDGTTMTVYDTYSYFNACGMASIITDTIHHLSHNNEFIPKKREE